MGDEAPLHRGPLPRGMFEESTVVNTLLRRTSAVLASALALTFGVGTQLPRAFAAERTATLVGSLQDELGCSADWQPSCADTELAREPGSTVYSRT